MIRIFIFTNILNYIFTFLLDVLNSVSSLIHAKLCSVPVSLSVLALKFPSVLPRSYWTPIQDLGSEHVFKKLHRGCLHPYLVKNH